MAKENNAVCSICGKEYYMCLSCLDAIKANPWKVHTDTPEHYKIFQVVRGFSTGVYEKSEAREKLRNVDLRDIEIFRPHIKDIIKNILEEDTNKKNDESVKSDEIEDVVVKDVIKTTYSRKKNYKVETE